MRLNRLSVVVFSVLIAPLVACGGDDDGGGGGVVVPDASVTPDAPSGPGPITSGLGKICNAPEDCAGNGTANGCLQAPGMPGFCTQVCVNSGSFMTDAQAMIIESSFMPATFDDAPCAASYQGTIGSGICGFIFNRQPGGPLAATTSYTFQAACAIACAADNSCPQGYVCDTATKVCDLP